MFKTIAIVLAVAVFVLIAAVLIFASTKPDSFRVQRQVAINAPPEKIYPLVNDYRNWGAWSPYEKKDPAMKRSYSGPASGKGAVYAWEGDSGVGVGRMEITQSSPPSQVLINLDFSKPFEAHNQVAFTIQPQGAASTVTWAMQGPAPLISRVMQVFFSMDKMVGQDFEVGLANLKTAAEK
ncbi:SRPBCC family protein [Polaromonas sp. P1(28)-13]|nr:SRPBCC family protein [Polaromonas sp. P1(28)-13]